MTVSQMAVAETAVNAQLKSILEKPLIVGASVSGDYFTASPGKRLALRYTTSAQIKVVAAKGRPGKEVLLKVSDASFKNYTSIIGMDLFFWDSFAKTPAETLKAIDRLLQNASAQKIPIVLGEVPALMPHMQPSLMAVNQKLNEACSKYSGCKLLPLNQILVKTLTDGYILHEGKKYTLESLVPDGLHIATPASEFLANEIEKLLI